MVIGSERIYPRDSITPDNFIKVELKNAVTDIIGSYKLAYPPPPAVYKNWDRDGSGLYGAYYSGAGESAHIQDMHIHAGQGQS